MNSFFSDAITSWNTFFTHFDDVPSFVTLKDYVNTFLRPNANSIFGIHDPKGRNFRHNCDETPSDICSCNQGIEDPNHFLFFCPTYIMPRATLAASVTNILQKHNLNYLGNQSHLLLYGHGSLNSVENKQILLSTIQYIKDTRRFTT